MNKTKEFTKGIWQENPVFKQLLGMCPTLAVTTTALNGLAMGLATSFVLVSSSIIVSSIRKRVPPQVRIATFTIIIATFVTVVDLFLKAEFPSMSKALGPYVPLIVVNCLILGRQEVFASRHPLGLSILDALGMGSGFVLSLVILGSIRELFSKGGVFGIAFLDMPKWLIMVLPAGAFITLGFLVALMNRIDIAFQERRG